MQKQLDAQESVRSFREPTIVKLEQNQRIHPALTRYLLRRYILFLLSTPPQSGNSVTIASLVLFLLATNLGQKAKR